MRNRLKRSNYKSTKTVKSRQKQTTVAKNKTSLNAKLAKGTAANCQL